MKEQRSFLDRYELDGYIQIDDIGVSEELINLSKKAAYRVLAKEYRTGIAPWGVVGNGISEVTRVSQVHLVDEDIRRVLFESDLGFYASKVMECKEVRVWGTQLYYKPTGVQNTGIVGFHRDSQHMPYFKKGVITAWLPLTNILDVSSPLIYIKGSHQWDCELISSGGQFQDLNAQRALLQSETSKYPWIEDNSTVPAGGVCYHNIDTLHGSGGNLSDIGRIAIAIGLFSEKVEVCNRSESYGYGEIMDDEYYCPLIYKE